MTDEILVSAQWLHEQKSKENLLIVDCASDINVYTRAHIPGAIFRLGSHYVKTVDDQGKQGLFIPSAKAFSELITQMGIHSNTTVVCYDDKGNYRATRFRWVLKYYGFPRIKILDGGWQSWVAAGYPISYKTHTPVVDLNPFHISPQEDLLVTKEQLVKAVNTSQWVILDVRSDEEYHGEEPEENKRKGHVPGAIHLDWRKLTNNSFDSEAVRTIRPLDELRAILAEHNIPYGKPIVTYCQSAIRATHTAFVLELLGYPDVRVYDGSMREWANEDDTQLE